MNTAFPFSYQDRLARLMIYECSPCIHWFFSVFSIFTRLVIHSSRRADGLLNRIPCIMEWEFAEAMPVLAAGWRLMR